MLRGLLAASALGLAACQQTSVVTNELYDPLYSRSLVNFVATDRDMPVVVYGGPAGEAGPGLAARVADAMQGHDSGQVANFTAGPTENAYRDFRVVVAFNPSYAGAPTQLCAGPVLTEAAAQDLEVWGAFCTGGRFISLATASQAGVTGTDSPAFDDLMAALTRRLFPRENPDRPIDSNNCRRFCT